jgi:nucleotide-binding universal stress UspA family protein
MLAKTFQIDTVYFLHVTSTLELPEDIAEKYGDMIAPVDETLEKEMEESLSKWFDPVPNCKVEVIAQAGVITEEVIKCAKIKRVDLIVLGRKKELDGSGLHSKKVARTSSASVVFVPENPPLALEKIMVPIDYSKYSQMAFELSADIQKQTGSKILSNHVYKVPTGYYKAGKTYEEFADIMLDNTKKESKIFFAKLGLEGVDFDFTYALDDDIHPADKIYKCAAEEKVDLIMLGSKGRSTAAAMLIGSVAEKLLLESADIPIFLVKKGNENVSLIEALLRL